MMWVDQVEWIGDHAEDKPKVVGVEVCGREWCRKEAIIVKIDAVDRSVT